MNFITGASSGIGRSLAKRIAASGEPVVVVARRLDLLESLVKEIESTGGRALAIRCDVTDRDAVHAAVGQAEAHFGATERLVANAGGAAPTLVDPFEAEHVAEVLELNVLSVAYCVEAVLPGMLERGRGHLVVTSSLAGVRALPNSGAYSAAKAALTNLMESLRLDLRGRGVDVSVIAPGFVHTKPAKPGKKKRNRPFRLELEPATARIWKAIQARKPYYAFPKTLVVILEIARLLPAGIYDRLLAGRGPKAKQKRLKAPA
jgi:short-subunit dehydrogenase